MIIVLIRGLGNRMPVSYSVSRKGVKYLNIPFKIENAAMYSLVKSKTTSYFFSVNIFLHMLTGLGLCFAVPSC